MRHKQLNKRLRLTARHLGQWFATPNLPRDWPETRYESEEKEYRAP